MNANTNINVLGGILDAMLANLVETIDKRVEAKVFTLLERIERLETDLKAVEGQLYDLKDGTPSVVQPTQDVILRLDKMEEQVGSLMNCQDNDQMENSRRITELEQRMSGEQPDTKFDLSILDSEEFRAAVIKIIDTHTMGDEFLNPLIDALIDSDKFNDKINEVAKEAADSAADEALDNHTSDYEHDDIHESSEIDADAVKDIIKEVLNNSTITLKI